LPRKAGKNKPAMRGREQRSNGAAVLASENDVATGWSRPVINHAASNNYPNPNSFRGIWKAHASNQPKR
jgi:hypothetical protein